MARFTKIGRTGRSGKSAAARNHFGGRQGATGRHKGVVKAASRKIPPRTNRPC